MDSVHVFMCVYGFRVYYSEVSTRSSYELVDRIFSSAAKIWLLILIRVIATLFYPNIYLIVFAQILLVVLPIWRYRRRMRG